MSTGGIIPVANETQSTSSRITKEGRKITYRMRVIQQPERARACGSGAKSSADRRPVDPPPIVELRVFEGVGGETDITFSYKANFFLFATLENARQLAQGRVPPQSQPSFPVLTGTPVAGMAYLDRPEPAGYFIFPDLSVRHEGKYRLSFSLYEELKEKGDFDTETVENVEQQKSAHVSHRLEVKSTPFTVFSAKKFPGLTESTQLSRIVAEQGCRVRIRRDVRMRRRGGDSKRDFEDDYEEPSYDRGRATATPEQYNHPMGTPQMHGDGMDRPRSASNASATSYMPQRRPSVEQISQTYQQSYAGSPVTPQAPQGMYPPQAPVQQWHGQPAQAGAYMQPPPSSYPSQQQGYQVPQSQPMAPPSYGFMPPQYQHYEQQGHGRHGSVEYPQPPTGPPRSTTTPQPLQHHQMPQYQQQQAQAPQYSNGYTQQVPAHASPIQPSQQSMQPPMQSPMTTSAPYAAAPQAPTAPQYAAPHIPAAEPQSQDYYGSKLPHQPQTSGAIKRTFAASFDTGPLDQPLRQGARPNVNAQDPKYNYLETGPDDDVSFEDAAMSYRRADGTERRRRIPLVS